MDIFQFILLMLWLFVLILLIKNKFQFNQTDYGLSRRAIAGFIIPIIVITGTVLFYFIYIYTVAYNPDYEYENTLKKVGYSIYRPSVLPYGILLDSKYYVYEKSFARTNNAVRSIYTIPWYAITKGEKDHTVILTQTKVDPNFDIVKLIETESSKSLIDSGFEKITLNKWPNQPVYLRDGPLKMVYLLTPDTILVSLGSISENSDTLIAMAESLY
jgi:hypothetical protein